MESLAISHSRHGVVQLLSRVGELCTELRGRSPLYIHGTVFMPFHIVAFDHIRMEVYRMFYFNTPYRVYNFIPRLRFRLLFISSTAYGDQIRIERLFVTPRVSDTLYHNGMMCES